MTIKLKDKTNIGVIGCGSVSEMYLDFLCKRPEVNLYACSDLNENLAVNTAKKYGIKKVMETNDILSDEDIEIILNLTNPINHFEINRKALMNKKSVFCEKPFALKHKDAFKLLNIAKINKCLFYSAPDTYFSRGIQTARVLLEKEFVGKALLSNVTCISLPVENWHPNPSFFYRDGSGPLYDRGVYYITVLVFLFGPIVEVSSYSNNFISERSFNADKNAKHIIKVNIPTNYVVLIKFKSGMLINLLLSFDLKVIPDESDTIQIFCTNGSIKLPSPLLYHGNIKYFDFKNQSWKTLKNTRLGYDIQGDLRGVAVLDMISHLKKKILSYENIEVATHVIEVMNAIDQSCKKSKHVKIFSTCKKHGLLIKSN